MDYSDLPGMSIDLDGRACTIITVTPLAGAGSQELCLTAMAVAAADGRLEIGAIPLILTRQPGNQMPRIIRPVEVFDEAGRLVVFKRPIAEHVADIDWCGMAGEPFRGDASGWPRPVRILTEAEQIREALSDRIPVNETEKRVPSGLLVRRLGVVMINPDGSARAPAAILADARARRTELEHTLIAGYALDPFLRGLDAWITELEERCTGATTPAKKR